MASFVLDCSTALSWCFDDESDTRADAALDALEFEPALVPSIWPLEILNALLVAERAQRISVSESDAVLEMLIGLPIRIVGAGGAAWMREVRVLARDHGLSSYDASYLHLAKNEGIPLATLDGKLRQAAEKANVPLYE